MFLILKITLDALRNKFIINKKEINIFNLF